VRLASDERNDPRRCLHRRQDRSTAWYRPLRRRIRRVVVGTDQSGPVPHRTRRTGETSEVERTVEPDHDDVGEINGRVITAALVFHHDRASGAHRLANPVAPTHQHALPRFDKTSSRDSGGQHIAYCRNSDCRQRVLLRLNRVSRVVGDEQHAVSSGPQIRDRSDGPVDRMVRKPHDTVEVAQHHTR